MLKQFHLRDGFWRYEKELVSELVYFLACEQVPGGAGGQIQLAVCAFWSNAILCRLAFNGLCSGGGGSDNVQFVNSRLRSRQKMPLLQRSKAILLSVI